MNVLTDRQIVGAIVAGVLTIGVPALAQPTTEPSVSAPVVEEPRAPTDENPVPTSPGLMPVVPEPITLDAPQTLTPTEPASTENDRSITPSIRAPADGSIQINVLDAIDVDSAGPLSPQEGGLGATTWQAASMPEVQRLMEDLPSPISSDILRELTVRLLMSGAPAPLKLDQINTNEGDFILRRLAALSALDAYDEVASLLAVVPGANDDLRFIRWGAVVGLMRGDIPGACSRASAGAGESDDPFWQQLLVVCQALAGRQSEAELGLSLMSELGETGSVYQRLIASLIYGQPAVLDRPPRADPLLRVLFNRAEATLDEDAMASLPSTPADSLRLML